MKRILLFIMGLTITMVSPAQSDSLKAAYQQTCTTLKEYKFLSQDVYYGRYDESTSITSITLKVHQGNFIFTIADKLCKFSDPAFGFKYQTKTIKVPVSEVRFYVGSYHNKMIIEGKNGIELTYKGEKELLRKYEIHGKELSLRKLHIELTRLQEILLSEEYAGSLEPGGTSNKKSTPKAAPKQEKKNETPVQPRQRKHVQSGN